MQRRSSIAGAGGDLAASLLFCALITLAGVTFANAEMKPLNPFAVEVPPAETAPAAPPSAFGPGTQQVQSPSSFGGIFGWVLRTQQSLQRDLATSVKSLKGEHAMAGAFMLAALSFIYGVVHAVGPGHGKTIISSYVVANEETVRRGVIISFIAAGLQALTAIALVGILAFALNASGMQMNAWSNQLEMVSCALIALVGLAAHHPAHRNLPALATAARGRSLCGTCRARSSPRPRRARPPSPPGRGLPSYRRCARPGRPVLPAQDPGCGVLGRRQAMHGGNPRADLRAYTRHVLGWGGGDLRHGHRNRHYRRGAGNARAGLTGAGLEARRPERRVCRCRVDDLRARRLGPHPALRGDAVRSVVGTCASILDNRFTSTLFALER